MIWRFILTKDDKIISCINICHARKERPNGIYSLDTHQVKGSNGKYPFSHNVNELRDQGGHHKVMVFNNRNGILIKKLPMNTMTSNGKQTKKKVIVREQMDENDHRVSLYKRETESSGIRYLYWHAYQNRIRKPWGMDLWRDQGPWSKNWQPWSIGTLGRIQRINLVTNVVNQEGWPTRQQPCWY